MDRDEALRFTRLVLFLKDNAIHQDLDMYDLVRVACDIMDLAKLNVSLMRRLMNHGSLGKRSEARLQAMRVKLRSMVDEGILIEDEHDIRSGLSLTIPEDTKHPALRHLDRSSYGYRLA